MEFYIINQVYDYSRKQIYLNMIKKGYWKADTLTKNIYPCAPFPDSCLGAFDNNTSQICDIGYIGPLCQTCDHNFAKYGGKQCGPCFSKGENYVVMIATFFGFMILLCVYIKSLFI